MTRHSYRLTSGPFPSGISMTVGIGPRKSGRVCRLMAPLRLRNWAQRNQLRPRSLVVESKAETVASQLQTELLVGLQASGFHHELLRPVGVDAPVSAFVSLGQRAAGHLRPKPQGIEPLASGAQAGLDLAQAFPGRQRREGQGQKLAAAREAAPPAVFCSGSTRRWNGSRSRPSVRWAKTVRLGLMPRDGTLPLSVWNKTTTLPNAPHPFQACTLRESGHL